MQLAPISDIQQDNPGPGMPLDQLARHLADTHAFIEDNHPIGRALLLTHLSTWEQTLLEAYQYFKATSWKDLAFSRAGEWMLDNYYVVEQTVHQIKEDLPKGFFNRLPKLDQTDLKGYPRVFALARELIGYSHGQLDLAQVATFVQDYQQVTPLTIGELWALPTMLRIGTLEHMATAVVLITGGAV